jgi:hypothetical protein
MFKGEGGGGAREEERHRRSIEHPGRRSGCPILVGQTARKLWRRCQGGGEAPPQYQTPREEERVPNSDRPFGPKERCGDTREEVGIAADRKGPREEERGLTKTHLP